MDDHKICENPQNPSNPRFRRYPEYKESSVEWIREIPVNWKILPFRHCLKKVETKKKTSIPKMDYQESGEFPIIDQGASFIAGWTDLTASVISDNLPIVIFGDHTRIFKYVDFPFTPGADGTQLLYPNDDILNPRFFYYALLNLKIPNEGYSRHYKYLREFSVACPTLPTQLEIANFLDRKTGQIDELIRVKERRIALLQEQRTALINQAVTKGLNPNVEMKPSGVEWIGEIPKHWIISKVKHEFESLDNLRIPLNAETRGSMKLKVYDYYGASGIIDKVENYIFDEPLILIGEDGANLRLRSTPLAFKATGKYWVNNHAHVLKPKHGNIDYLTNMLESLDYTHYITGAAQPKLTSEHLMNITVIVPSPLEQAKIADFLDHKTRQIDELVATEQRKIELLKEYRQSLISEAVTGKIDVRNEV